LKQTTFNIMASLLASDQNRKDMYKSSGTNSTARTQHRQNSAVSIRKKKRQKHLSSKRLKLSNSNTNSSSTNSQPTLTEAAISDIVKQALITLRNKASVSTLTGALSQLRKLLSEVVAHFPPIATVVQLGGVPILIQYLTSASAEHRLEATWCLSNIASGSHEEAQHVLPAVPYLISFLTGPEPALREQR
jgi:hypothetical protein